MPHDIDIVVRSFDGIPRSLGRAFLCWHVHPDASSGRLLLQLVDTVEAIRIDIFGARGAALERRVARRVGGIEVYVLSLEDLVANSARLLLDLRRGAAVPRKHLVDFGRLRRDIDIERMNVVWPDYRRDDDPLDYRTAVSDIDRLVAAHPARLIVSRYGSDASTACPRCRTRVGFPRASAEQVRGVLGYV